MTNAEKYLKEGVDEVAFAGELADIFLSKMNEKYPYAVDTFIEYFHDLAEPQLTVDERVILNHINVYEFDKIGRANNGNLYLHYKDDKDTEDFWWCDHLFKFIKERRRI